MASANGSSKVPEPKSAKRVDLYNFEEPENSRSRYILTSPRSLEACARLDIKPVDLLAKSYEQFVAGSSGLGLHKTALQLVYKEYEEQRLQRLHSARLERERIIEGQQIESHKSCTRQRGKTRSQSVMTSSSDRKPPSFSASKIVLQEKEATHNSLVGLTRDRSMSATLPMSQTSRVPKSVDFPSAIMSLPEKDQRILQALAQKMSGEQELEEIGKVAAQLRHEEAILEQASKQVLEKQRREQLEQQKRADQMKLMEKKKVQESAAQEEAMLRQSQAEQRWKQWTETAQQQAIHKAQLVEEKSRQQKRKKAEQEKRRKMLEAREQAEKMLTEEYLEAQFTQVAMNKEDIERRQMLERQARSNGQHMRHVEWKTEVEKLESDKTEYLRQIVHQKTLLGEQRHRQQEAMKNSQLQKSALDRRVRSEQGLMNRQMMDNQLQEWQKAVEQYTRASATKAEEIAEQTALEKSQRAAFMRKTREEDQWRNKQRIEDEEAERKLVATLEIDRKNARATDLLTARHENIQKSRHAAGASAHMRQQLKESYQRSTFDRMARDAELQASIGNRRRSTFHNKSHVVIG